nr:GDP-mannose 4,6-dehydratase [Fretibacterium sp.]
MRALITGSLGFVGHYLREELERHGYDVMGLDIRPGERTLQADLLDKEQTAFALRETQPDIVIHLAGQANVAKSWSIPQKTFEINVIAALNLMESVRDVLPQAHLVLVGSSDEYGILGAAGASVSESTPPNPQTPYAVSKLAQEQMACVYARAYKLNICMTRSFNHGGAGQQEGFLIPDFTSGIVRVEKGLQPCLRVGNLDSRRDFTHVRDVVRAYRLLAEKGRPGEIYNVGSGKTHSAREILEKLLALSNTNIPVEQDPAKMRPSDTPVICCNHEKLTRDTGWEPQLGLDQILRDVLAEWR